MKCITATGYNTDFDANSPFTLADYLVFEGRADYFAGRLFTHRAPWTTALDTDAYASTWLAMSKDLSTTDWGEVAGLHVWVARSRDPDVGRI